ncbi:MAG TPA: carboxypeptidase-like regulatory domain-containing protein [Candidatus Acidoferrales bacterium]|nr:carboxypeptidase-like regulatory domain-containing protein [Candidatus Acidoferrales bacterium]
MLSRPKRLLWRSFAWLSLGVVAAGFPVLARAQQVSSTQGAPSAGAQPSRPQSPGSVTGTVIDQTEALLPGALVVLTRPDDSTRQETETDRNGQFSFANVPSGPFQLSISAANFATEVVSGTVSPGQTYVVPEITLPLATQVTRVTVGLTQEEVAEEQVKLEEKQRVLGFIPNFYVSYVPDAAPLTPKQKFGLAWKTSIDPVTFLGVGVLAGVQQATNQFKGYGQGAQGYAKRFGATYADVVDGTFLGSAVFPSLLKQDPRYFYKGTGSFRSRLLYALSNAVMCKGDNKQWQPNYSNILGNFAAGGIANLYYPASNRGVGLTFETAGIRIGETAVAGVFQEFIIRKLTPNLPPRNVSQP